MSLWARHRTVINQVTVNADKIPAAGELVNAGLTPFQVLGSAFAIAALAGLGTLLKSSRQITTRSVLGVTIYNGLTGLAVASIWYDEYGVKNPYLLFGVSAVAGLAGLSALELLAIAWRKMGVKIVVDPRDGNDRG